MYASWLAMAFVGLLICAAADLVLLTWMHAGSPPGKGQLFFRELVEVMGGSFVLLCLSISRPELGRMAVPFVFIFLGWHTGLQLNWTDDQLLLVVSAVDVLTLILLAVAFSGGWHRTPTGQYLLGRLGKPLAAYLLFCLWGFGVAVIRGVDVSPFYGNMKTMTLYPVIALLIPLCIRSWRELYAVVGFFLLCVMERTLEGLRGHSAGPVAVIHTVSGQTLDRINGNMASVNQYAFYIMSGLLILTAILVAGRRPYLRVALVPAVGLVALALLLTYSRGAWLGLAVGSVTLALLLGARRIAALIVVVAGAYFVVTATQPSATTLVSTRLNDVYAQQTIVERQDYLALGWSVIKDYPLGAGWGAAFHQTLFGLAEDHTASAVPWYHNDYVQLATEIGPAGLAAFLWLWAAILWLGLRTLRSVKDANQRALVLGLFCAVPAMLVQAATDQFMWRSDVGPHVWMIAGFLLAAVALHQVKAGHQPDADASGDHLADPVPPSSVSVAEPHAVGSGAV
jgi:O-antigen ligase